MSALRYRALYKEDIVRVHCMSTLCKMFNIEGNAQSIPNPSWRIIYQFDPMHHVPYPGPIAIIQTRL